MSVVCRVLKHKSSKRHLRLDLRTMRYHGQCKRCGIRLVQAPDRFASPANPVLQPRPRNVPMPLPVRARSRRGLRQRYMLGYLTIASLLALSAATFAWEHVSASAMSGTVTLQLPAPHAVSASR